jgi:hypothetical protein
MNNTLTVCRVNESKRISRFDFFEKGFALMGARVGIVSIGLLCKYDRYKTYLEFLEIENNKRKAIDKTVRRLKCDYSTIYRDIYFFERDDVAYIGNNASAISWHS